MKNIINIELFLLSLKKSSTENIKIVFHFSKFFSRIIKLMKIIVLLSIQPMSDYQMVINLIGGINMSFLLLLIQFWSGNCSDALPQWNFKGIAQIRIRIILLALNTDVWLSARKQQIIMERFLSNLKVLLNNCIENALNTRNKSFIFAKKYVSLCYLSLDNFQAKPGNHIV